jgi:hypothetical protein
MIDRAFELFSEYKSKFKQYAEMSITEADTRSKIIDKIFIDILGWDEDDINREKYVKIGYYDYEISTSIFKFVV